MTTAQATGTPPPAEPVAAPRMELSRDGVFVHPHDDGWKEIKTGCISTTRTRVPRQRPEPLVIPAAQPR